MKIHYLGAMLFLFGGLAIAQTEPDFPRQFSKPFVGVKIVPPQEMVSNEGSARVQQFRTNGYVQSETENPKRLMEVKNRIPQESVKAMQASDASDASDPYHYYLRKNVEAIPLSFHYQPVSRSELLGFAPAGTKINTGWTGIREFFENMDFGICSLTKYHIVNSKMGIRINANAVTYKVNSHPTTFEVEGSEKSGFIYTVSWVDSVFSNTFECAKNFFDEKMIDKMIAYASKTATIR